MRDFFKIFFICALCMMLTVSAIAVETAAPVPEDATTVQTSSSEAPVVDAPVEEIPELDLISVYASADGNAASDPLNPGGEGTDGECPKTLRPQSHPCPFIPAKLTLGVGQKYALYPDVSPEGAQGDITFSSGKKKVAKVGKTSGVITAKKKGSATITVRSGDVEATCKVTVKKAPSKITLKTARTTLGSGEFSKVTAKLTKGSAANITFTSSAPDVLFVDENGDLIARDPGTATITAKTHNGKKAKKKFTVKPAPAGIGLNASALTLPQGKTFELIPTLTEGSASPITFTSTDSGVAAVDEDGVVTCVYPGTASVTASTFNGHHAVCTFTVKPGPDAITMDVCKRTLGIGEKFTLGITVSNSATADYIADHTLKSSKKSIASVSSEGTIKAKKAGKTTITAKAPNGVKDTCKITVKKAPTSIRFSDSSVSVYIGSRKSTSIKFNSGQGGGVSYSSSKESVATVDAKGRITGISAGTATITAKTYNGKKARCKVRVYEDVGKRIGKDGDNLEILFMDIGRNDGILLHCGGEYAFIDSGIQSYGAKALKEMQRLGVTHLKYYIGTHAHRDHVGGAPTILAGIPTDTVIMPHSGVESMIRRVAETSAQKKAVKKVTYRTLKAGQSITLGGTVLNCLGPIKVVRTTSSDIAENGNSLVLKAVFGNRSVLLTGDATDAELKAIHKANKGCLRSDVLKNPHHNGKLSETSFKRIRPSYVVFSTHKKNLPSKDYLKILAKYDARYFITASNKHSHTLFVTDGDNMAFYTKR